MNEDLLTEDALKFFTEQCEIIAANYLGKRAEVVFILGKERVLMDVRVKGKSLNADSSDYMEIFQRFQRYLATAKPN